VNQTAEDGSESAGVQTKRYFLKRGTVSTWWDLEEKGGSCGTGFAETLTNVLEGVDVKDKTVLDVGTGRGRFASAYSLAGAASVVLLDLSREMLESAIRRTSSAIPHGSFVLCDAESLCFKEGVFDVVSCLSTLIHVPRPEVALSELMRVCKPGGTAVFDVNLSTVKLDQDDSSVHSALGEGMPIELVKSWNPEMVREARPLVNSWTPDKARSAARSLGGKISKEKSLNTSSPLLTHIFFVKKQCETGRDT